ncbi:hypothetical protein NSQ77_20010 [Oceanobacillus sp. FSL K6-2867]|uniref:hypothetical protein n=1 Tax=Oceanobacillus sp. FSL K6-2867 TaxID=2954748 RepID=UPI0030D86E63
MAEDMRLTIGMADVTVGGVKVGRQADAMVFSAEPVLQEVDLYLAYAYDRIIEGWTVTATIVVDEESYEHYKMALAGVEEDTNGSITDGVGMKSLRKEAKELIIHPADLPESDKSFDITIFKAVPTGAVERTYGKEVAGYEITFTGLHRTGSPKESGNYFRIGEAPATT